MHAFADLDLAAPRQDFLRKNKSSSELLKSRPEARHKAIEQMAIEQEAREERARLGGIRERAFAKSMKQQQGGTRGYACLAREVLGNGVLPITPKILMQLQWLTAAALVISAQDLHKRLEQKRAENLRICFPKSIQLIWRAKHHLRKLRARRAARRQLGILCLVARFAGKLLRRRETKRRAVDAILSVLRGASAVTDKLFAARRKIQNAALVVQRGFRRLVRQHVAMLEQLRELWVDSE